jgi:hypothetical protein
LGEQVLGQGKILLQRALFAAKNVLMSRWLPEYMWSALALANNKKTCSFYFQLSMSSSDLQLISIMKSTAAS